MDLSGHSTLFVQGFSLEPEPCLMVLGIPLFTILFLFVYFDSATRLGVNFYAFRLSSCFVACVCPPFSIRLTLTSLTFFSKNPPNNSIINIQFQVVKAREQLRELFDECFNALHIDIQRAFESWDIGQVSLREFQF